MTGNDVAMIVPSRFSMKNAPATSSATAVERWRGADGRLGMAEAPDVGPSPYHGLAGRRQTS